MSLGSKATKMGFFVNICQNARATEPPIWHTQAWPVAMSMAMTCQTGTSAVLVLWPLRTFTNHTPTMPKLYIYSRHNPRGFWPLSELFPGSFRLREIARTKDHWIEVEVKLEYYSNSPNSCLFGVNSIDLRPGMMGYFHGDTTMWCPCQVWLVNPWTSSIYLP